MGSKRKLPIFPASLLQLKWINKYSITLMLFLVWLTFFDKNNLITQYKLDRKVESMEKQKLDYQNKLVELNREKEELEQNKENYARKNYYLHKENEEVFIIEKE